MQFTRALVLLQEIQFADTNMATLLVLNGPNLNLLGSREPDTYGHTSLDEIEKNLEQLAGERGHRLQTLQSNAEHELIDRIHQARNEADFILINPAAFTHTSIALRDALAAVAIPYIEIHLSNVHGRERFRHRSYFSSGALAVICGFGADGYRFALEHAMNWLEQAN